jgi:hypothetical protein
MQPYALAVVDLAGTTVDDNGSVERAVRVAVQETTGRLPGCRLA